MTSKVKLVSITQSLIDVEPEVAQKMGIDVRKLTPEEHLIYVARVSSPKNQKNINTTERLLNYCFTSGHVSIFEQVEFAVEITTSQAISAQLLRHSSAKFQQKSGRYSSIETTEPIEFRLQDTKNRQNSLDLVGYVDADNRVVEVYNEDEELKYLLDEVDETLNHIGYLYSKLLDKGIAKECARGILSVSHTTTLYMKNNLRNWIHYILARTKDGVQKEHKEVALLIRDIVKEQFPITSRALVF